MCQETTEVPVVLLRQNLGRRQHGCRLAAADSQQHGTEGHQRLAAADIALQQSVHLLRRCHISPDFVHTALLRGSEPERQMPQQLLHIRVADGCHLPRAPLRPAAAPGNAKLAEETLLQRKAQACLVLRLFRCREMDVLYRLPVGVRGRYVVSAGGLQLIGQVLQDAPYAAAVAARRHTGHASVNGDYASGMHRLAATAELCRRHEGASHRCHNQPMPGILIFHDFKIGISHGEHTGIFAHAAIYVEVHPHRQQFGHVGHIKPTQAQAGAVRGIFGTG